MLVVCPQCDSRYQLPDNKIRPQGTKVRCPSCQHKFVVKREIESDSEEVTKTKQSEVTKKTQEVERPPSIDSEMPAALKSSEEKAFDGSTRISVKPNLASGPRREPSPFRHRTPAAEFSDPKVIKSEEKIAPPEPIEEEDSKPFGDATFLAIRQMSKKKKNFGKKTMLIAAVASMAAGLYLAWPFLSNIKFGTPVQTGGSSAQVQVNHPDQWYRDDPRVFQKVLTDMAALPPDARDENSNKALRSEALILNGIYTEQSSQIAKGVAIASSLIPRFPNSSAGFLGMATFHLFNDDADNLRLLVESWPSSGHTDLEYQLSKVVVTADEGQVEQALEQLKELLKQKNDFQRAYTIGFYLSIKSPRTSEQILGTKWLGQMRSRYLRHRDQLKEQDYSLPQLYINIDRALAKADPAFLNQMKAERREEKKNPESKKNRVVTNPEEKSTPKPPPPNPFEQKKQTAATTPPSQKKEIGPKKSSKRLTRLPQESKNLREQTQLALKGVSEARKLYREGNQLYKSKKYDGALAKYREALKQNPDFADVYKKMGEIYMNDKQKDRALRSFKIYLQLSPDSSDKKVVEGWISKLQ